MTIAAADPQSSLRPISDALADFVVRVAGLPAHHTERLRFERTGALIDEWLELERDNAAAASAISDALFERIGAVDDPSERGPLIALRRSIFNGQAPKQLERAAAHLPEDLFERIQTLEVCRQRQGWIAQHGQSELEAEWLSLREHLRDSAANPDFQRGLLLSSQDLHTEVLEWLQHPPSTARRKLELSLVQYILRASTKTSPFSTLTSLARGRWGERTNRLDWSRQGYGELSRSLANQLMQVFAQWPSVRDSLWLTPNPSLRRIGNAWHFFAWRRGEKFSAIAHQPTLEVLFQCATQPHTTYGRVLETIFSADPIAGRDFLDRLIRLGALELHYRMPERDPRHFEAFHAQIAVLEHEEPEIWSDVQQLRQGLEQFEYLPSQAKRTTDQALRRLCASPKLSERGLTMPTRNTIFEDTLIPDLEYELEPGSWGEVRADLRRLTKLYALKDLSWATRQQALRVFENDFVGAGDTDLLAFYHRYREQTPPTTSETHTPDLLAAHHQEFQDYATAQHGQLEREWIDAFTTRFSATFKTPRTISFYAQPLTDGPGLVLNSLQAGAGRAKARLRRFECKLGFESPLEVAAGTSRIPVDLGGVFSTNVNLREPITEFEIPYPGYHSDRPAEHQLQLKDLRVRYDSNSSNLILIAPHLGDVPLEPIHTGLIGERWYPPLFQFLIHLFGAAPIDPTSPRLRPWGLKETPAFMPRLTLGRVVIERARWTLPANAWPTQKPGDSLFQHLRNLAAWRIAHGIPDQVFLQHLGGNNSKPTFVDFRNAFSIDLLQRQLDGQGVLVLHEVLPRLGCAGIAHRSGSFVHELVLESTIERWET
jgi:hypothetical protein